MDLLDELTVSWRKGGIRSMLGAMKKRHASGRRRGEHAPLPWSAQGPDAPTPIGFHQVPSGPVVTLKGKCSRRFKRRLDRAIAVVPGPMVGIDEIVRLASSGVPLAGETSRFAVQPSAPFLELAQQIGSTSPSELVDSRLRELHSVRLRRLAAGIRRERALSKTVPDVAILVATNRPSDLDHCLQQIEAQTIRPSQVVFGLHGDDWDRRDGDRIVAMFGDRAIVRFCSPELNLGQVLNELSAAATSEFVTKWDDDDWYGSHHLEDLLSALSYSGADLVGKAAEFVRFEEMDVTIRRFRSGSETYTRTLAGGTLLLRRSTLQGVGGWEPIPRNVDRGLIDAVLDAGGSVYRTHGFEYVLRRRSSQHTWSAPDEYFLTGGIDSRPGLDLRFAGIDR